MVGIEAINAEILECASRIDIHCIIKVQIRNVTNVKPTPQFYILFHTIIYSNYVSKELKHETYFCGILFTPD
jgi:hypothetical protein